MDLRLSYPPTPENAGRLAALAVDAAREVSGFDLDYTSLSVILVEEQVSRLAASGLPVVEVASTLFCLGCYVGEVIVRNLHGKWEETELSPLKGLAMWPMVVVMPNRSCWNPIGKVFKRFDEGEGESLINFLATVEDYSARLAPKSG